MLGAYLATSLIAHGFDFWTAALVAGLLVAVLGGIVERLILRRLAGAELAQVLVTLGLSFMIADVCLMVWTGDPIRDRHAAGAARRHLGAWAWAFRPIAWPSASLPRCSRWRCGCCSTARAWAR